MEISHESVYRYRFGYRFGVRTYYRGRISGDTRNPYGWLANAWLGLTTTYERHQEIFQGVARFLPKYFYLLFCPKSLKNGNCCKIRIFEKKLGVFNTNPNENIVCFSRADCKKQNFVIFLCFRLKLNLCVLIQAPKARAEILGTYFTGEHHMTSPFSISRDGGIRPLYSLLTPMAPPENFQLRGRLNNDNDLGT